MLVNFIGVPCSGKTTTAAMAMAALKERGIPCEFIPEQARWYIAEKRVRDGLRVDEPVVLDDDDQLRIMERQAGIEDVLTSAVSRDVVVISDSSVLLSLLYMTDAGKKHPYAKKLVESSSKKIDLLFYSRPVPYPSLSDPNRIHDQETSRKLDERLLPLIEENALELTKRIEMIPLAGYTSTRHTVAVSKILAGLLVGRCSP